MRILRWLRKLILRCDILLRKMLVSDYIIPLTLWNIDHLFNILSNNIINKIESIPIPVTYVKDKKDGHLDSWRILS